ncbi:hypothetical protein O9X81_05225 [Agrobacterium salinitolerans]|uniref:hypothetical protein n=1 Tax=Agrobacterium salinitolerans TaxID=1183413 RepID=UPI0022B84A79|nr:hypothetical protein [Agrobacterium salinitolerans]MCZ7856008.1 hypothetical protein [Agrobacterium salinitolerans]
MADQNPDLLKQADELGIKTDKRWGDDRLTQEIDKALNGEVEQEAPAAAMIPMVINRDIWVTNPANPDEPIRHRSGKVMNFTVDDAMAGLETGALSRVKG